jgi:hypothetical protein
MFKRSIGVLLLILVFAGIASALGWPPTKDEALDAGMKILAMSKKGYVSIVDVEPSPAVLIEPLGWRGFTHRDKVLFTRVAAIFFHGLAEERHKKFIFVFVRDMTTNAVLAYADLKTGEVEIKK